MISVEEALRRIENNAERLSVEERTLTACLGYVLAQDVHSPIDMPSFNQSAMDGYALCYEDGLMDYKLVGEVAAGSSLDPELKIGECVRIFTGAMVPNSANLVVQQEWIERKGNEVKVLKEVAVGKNIRKQGEQIVKGDLAMLKGAVINPAAIGFLTGLGVSQVPVFRKPKIAIITTGNELVSAGEVLQQGQVYESNSGMLEAALSQYHFDDFTSSSVEDNYEATKLKIKTTISASDMVILTGGISVGDYDFVGKSLQELGVKELFYKIKQKPGKPIYMGKIGGTLIAALPGNPAAALSCFYLYVLPALNRAMGKAFSGLESFKAELNSPYQKKGDRAQFLKGKLENDKLTILGAQSSAMLSSFALANVLIYIPADKANVENGELVTAYRLEL